MPMTMAATDMLMAMVIGFAPVSGAGMASDSSNGSSSLALLPPLHGGGRRRSGGGCGSSRGRRSRDGGGIQDVALGMDPRLAHLILDLAPQAELLRPQEEVRVVVAVRQVRGGAGVDVVAAASPLRLPDQTGAVVQVRHATAAAPLRTGEMVSHGGGAGLAGAVMYILNNSAVAAVALVNVLDGYAHPQGECLELMEKGEW